LAVIEEVEEDEEEDDGVFVFVVGLDTVAREAEVDDVCPFEE